MPTMFLLIPILLLIADSSAKRSVGRLVTSNDFIYLERFCFISELGNLFFELRYPLSMLQEMGPQSLLMYYDEPMQWPAAYRQMKTCDERIGLLDPTNKQQIVLSPYEEALDLTTSCKIDDYTPEFEGDEWITCRGNRRFISRRARWWFLAVANCANGSNPVYIEYDISMTNGPPDNLWFYQFSADEFYILPVDLAFLILEGVMLFVSISMAYSLKSRHMLHQTFRLFVQSVIIECSSLVLRCWAYAKYAQDGVGYPALKLFGHILRAASTTSFILLLLLIAKGYTITRGRLSSRGTWSLILLIVLYCVLYLCMYVWQIKVFDPARITYVSESAAGYGLALLRLTTWLSYSISTYYTVKKYPKKRDFYIILGFFMTFWFWMGPITLCLANYLLDNWVREEVVNAVDNGVVLYGFVVFTVLMWPSSSNKNFPFHVRTTQVGDGVGPANFPQSAYELTAPVSTVSTNGALSAMPKDPPLPVDDDEMTY